jgi:hypothetical protein
MEVFVQLPRSLSGCICCDPGELKLAIISLSKNAHWEVTCLTLTDGTKAGRAKYTVDADQELMWKKLIEYLVMPEN